MRLAFDLRREEERWLASRSAAAHGTHTGHDASAPDYSGALTEANHLGNVAYRAGRKIEWDHVKFRAKNAPEAAQFIRREYRPGWTLEG